MTGAAGFIGSHVVDHLLKETDWDLVLLDRLDTSGTLRRFQESVTFQLHKTRTFAYWHDLRAPINTLCASHLGQFDYIFHLAASSHVDRSITDPLSFVYDNVVGTANLLDFARTQTHLQRLIYFSTDEVFGPAPTGVRYKEWDRYKSGNPYAATKAGGEELAVAYHNTYGLPVIITHTMNVFGERQHPEKYIPSTIAKARDGKRVTIHADKTRTIPGSRFYIHARNVAAGVLFVLDKGEIGEKYNLVGEREVNNLELAQFIASAVGQPLDYELVDFNSQRPGHDLRYALDGSKLEAMGWKLPVDFHQSLYNTVHWSLRNPHWLL